jgi:alpha-L-fucosidase
MVTELWGNYGPLTYIWFDGGVLPPEKGGVDVAPIQRRLQPHAVTFGGPPENPAGLSRWVGNENGVTAYPNWSTVKHDNDEGAGDPQGRVWEPGECDVPLRKQQWFWHPNQEKLIRSLDELMDIYYKSVGRNANMIINASINRDGLVPDADMKRFKEFGDEIRRRFEKPIAQTSGEGASIELDLGKPATINHVIMMEQLAQGERIRQYTVEGFAGGAWKELCSGQSVGHKRIDRFGDMEVSKVRVRVTQSTAAPQFRQLAVYNVTAKVG